MRVLAMQRLLQLSVQQTRRVDNRSKAIKSEGNQISHSIPTDGHTIRLLQATYRRVKRQRTSHAPRKVSPHQSITLLFLHSKSISLSPSLLCASKALVMPLYGDVAFAR